MTQTEQIKLGQRWLAAGGGYGEGWQVFETDYGTIARLVWRDADHWHAVTAGPTRAWLRIRHENMGTRVPDFSDPATKGAALEVVRERWGIKRLWVEFQVDNAMWSVGDWVLGWACLDGETPPPDIMADSEEELLVAALEAAGGPK